jgi:hypothetical protein
MNFLLNAITKIDIKLKLPSNFGNTHVNITFIYLSTNFKIYPTRIVRYGLRALHYHCNTYRAFIFGVNSNKSCVNTHALYYLLIQHNCVRVKHVLYVCPTFCTFCFFSKDMNTSPLLPLRVFASKIQ